MDSGLFNVRTDVNACDCAQGCTDTVRESALKVDAGRKIPCRTGESNLRRRRAGPMLYQLSYIPTTSRANLFFFFLSGDVAQLVEHRTGTSLTQIRFPGAARDFSPSVKFQCRLSYSVRTPPCANACIYICAHFKDPLVHVKSSLGYGITKTPSHTQCIFSRESSSSKPRNYKNKHSLFFTFRSILCFFTL